MIVMMMAITPSLKASTRPLPIGRFPDCVVAIVKTCACGQAHRNCPPQPQYADLSGQVRTPPIIGDHNRTCRMPAGGACTPHLISAPRSSNN
jgi:hypothetical protein